MSKYRIEAGRYHQPAQLQKRQMAQDSYGETTQDWTTVANIRVAVQPISGKEFYDKQAVNPEITHRVRMRYSRSLNPTPDMRILVDGHTFMITDVIDWQFLHNEYQMMCKELIDNE